MDKKERIVDYIKRNGRVSRKDLSNYLGVSDRKIRDLISDINASDAKYQDILVIGTSDCNGYTIASSVEELKHFINERKKRAAMTLIPVPKGERLLKEFEEK